MCLDRCGEFARSRDDHSGGRDLSDSSSSGDVEVESVATSLFIPIKGAIARSLEKPGVGSARKKQIPKAKAPVLTQFQTSLVLKVCRHHPPIPQGPLSSMTKSTLFPRFMELLRRYRPWLILVPTNGDGRYH